MRKIIMSCIIFCIILNLCAEEGIVIDNNVRIREKANLHSEIVGTAKRGDFITIYSYEGSGQFADGILDLWARISEKSDRWINAYWITLLPFTYYDESENVNGLPVIPETISSYYDGNKNIFQRSVWNLEERNIEKYGSVSVGDLTFSIGQARSNFFIQKIMLSPDLQKIDSEKYRAVSADKTEAYYTYDGVRIREQVVTADEWNWAAYVDDVSIENNQLKCIFGIHTGMKKAELLQILGKPYSEDGNVLLYGFELKGGITMAYFAMVCDIVKSIHVHQD
jgi:hypothetical protein